MRARVFDLADQLPVSPEDLVTRCRDLLRLLRALAVDLDREDLRIFRAVDSVSDAWPVGVDPERLDPDYLRRFQAEMWEYSQRV